MSKRKGLKEIKRLMIVLVEVMGVQKMTYLLLAFFHVRLNAKSMRLQKGLRTIDEWSWQMHYGADLDIESEYNYPFKFGSR